MSNQLTTSLTGGGVAKPAAFDGVYYHGTVHGGPKTIAGRPIVVPVTTSQLLFGLSTLAELAEQHTTADDDQTAALVAALVDYCRRQPAGAYAGQRPNRLRVLVEAAAEALNQDHYDQP